MPVPHFGVVLDWAAWHALAARLRDAGVSFVIEPGIRFPGQVGEQATMFLLDPSGKKAYLFNYLSNNITVIDIATRGIFTTIPTETGPLRGAFNRQGDKLLVIHEWSPNLLIFDVATLAVVKKVLG